MVAFFSWEGIISIVTSVSVVYFSYRIFGNAVKTCIGACCWRTRRCTFHECLASQCGERLHEHYGHFRHFRQATLDDDIKWSRNGKCRLHKIAQPARGCKTGCKICRQMFYNALYCS